MSPLLHHLDALFEQNAVAPGDGGIRRQEHVSRLAWLELQHAAAERMPLELATQPAGGRAPRRREPRFKEAAIAEQVGPEVTARKAFVHVHRPRFTANAGDLPLMYVRTKAGRRHRPANWGGRAARTAGSRAPRGAKATIGGPAPAMTTTAPRGAPRRNRRDWCRSGEGQP